jgi:hypothetical protein
MDALLIEAEKLVDEADAASRKERVEAAAIRLKHVKEQEARDAERARLKAAGEARVKEMRETRSPVVTIEGQGLIVKITVAHPDPTVVLQAKEGVRVVTHYFAHLFQEQTEVARGGGKITDVAKTRKLLRARLEDELRYLRRTGQVSIEDSK